MQDAPVRADCARRLRVYRVALISEFVRNIVLGKIAELYGDLTGEICAKWNERESTWRKSGSCQSRGTSQSKS